MGTSDWKITEVFSADPDTLSALNRLLPQLSKSASPVTEAELAAIADSPASHLLMAFCGDEVGGMLTLVLVRIPTGVRAHIEDVVVGLEWRGMGVGRMLTEAALELARSLGAKTVDLTSRPSRIAAHALYRSVGFEVRDTSVYRYQWEER